MKSELYNDFMFNIGYLYLLIKLKSYDDLERNDTTLRRSGKY